MRLSVLSLLLVGLCAVSAGKYDGYRVVRVDTSKGSAFWLEQAIKVLDLNVYSRGQDRVDVLVQPHNFARFSHRLRTRNMKSTILVENLQKAIDEQMESIRNHKRPEGKAVDHTTYRDLATLNAELDEIETNYPSLMSSYSAGTTYEGRDIRVVKISSDNTDTRPVQWIDCGIHAREWISAASCMYFVDQLTSLYGSDTEVTAILDTYDFHVMPVANPDGYEYTWSADRMWRKNRVPYGNCFGADCNRNFDSNFGGEGASDLACADTYHGPSAFSEAESAAIRDASLALGARLKAFTSVHSYSQYWMTPYGYNYTLPTDFDEMMRVANIGATALSGVYGTRYQVGNIADIIYVASGGSIDWVYDELGTVYSYALELRDRGIYGFLLPEDQITPTCIETWEGLKAAIQAMV